MSLTQEEIQQYRTQYNVGPSVVPAQKNPAERIAELRQSAQRKKQTEDYKQTDEGKSFLKKMGETRSKFEQFATGVGKGLVSTVRGASKLGEKALQAPLKAGGVDFPEKTGAEQLIPEEVVTPKTKAEKAGFVGEQIAEFFVPWTKIAKMPQVVGKVRMIPKIIEQAGDFTLRAGVQEGEISGGDMVAGLALGGGFRIGAKAFNSLTNKLPQRLIRGILKQPKKEIKAGKDVSEYVLENKKIGNVQSLFDDSVKGVEDFSNQIQKKLGSQDVKNILIDRNKIYQTLKQNFAESGIGLKEINDIVKKLSPQAAALLKESKLTLPQANRLRQLIDKTLGDRVFLGAQLPFNKEVLKSFNTVLRNEVKQKAPEGTRKLFDTLSKEITLRNALDGALSSGTGNRVLGLTDFITIGGGSAILGAPGAIMATAAKKIAETPQARMGAAKTFKGLQKLEELKNIVPPGLKGLVNEIIDSVTGEKSN